MIRACLTFVSAVAMVIALLQLSPVSFLPLSIGAQAPTTTAKTDATTKTAWGDPDLQGIWTKDTNEPLQRNPKYGNRETLTPAETAEIDQKVSAILGREASDSRRNRKGTEQDVGGAYNQAVFLSHLRTGRRTSMIVDPPDGRIPPFTPEQQAKRGAMRQFQLAMLQATDECKSKLPACAGGTYGPPSPRRAELPPFYLYNSAAGPGGGGAISRSDGPEDRGHGERCLLSALPDFGGFRRIVQSPGQISMYYDVGQGQGWQRIIPITTAPHLPANVRQWWGDSRGRWEGNTLVVDVTNFSPLSDFQGSHENLHLVERWTRLSADTLEYVVKIEDPTVWTKPWTVKADLRKQDDGPNRIYYEPRCHEGNYGMVALLEGARTQERAFAAGKGPDPATKCMGACGGFGGGFADEGEDSNPR